MKLCAHVVTNDAGLAPNPFHGFCTTALCTPSHMRARLRPGDWLIGNSSKADGNRLVYAMRVAEVLEMDAYFRDPCFQAKKPAPAGAPEEQCGDNLYFRENGRWRRLPSQFHNSADSFLKDVGRDLAGRPVFVSQYFYYFGRNRVPIPDNLHRVVREVQGIHYPQNPLPRVFVSWLESAFAPGVHGRPLDLASRSQSAGPMITECPDPLSAEGQAQRSARSRPSRGGCH